VSGLGLSSVSGFLRARSGAVKAAIALVGPATAIISTLLALNVITPFGEEDAIAKGLDKTRAASTSAISVELDVRSPANGASPTSFSAEGRFDHDTGRGRLSFDFGQTEGFAGASNVEAIFAGRIVFLKAELPGGATPADRPWLRIDPVAVTERLRELQAFDESAQLPADLSFLAKADFVDPSQALDYLERSSDLEEVGERPLFGRKTTLHSGHFTQNGSRFRVRVWIDEDDLIRRLEVTGGPEEIAYTVSFRDFDVPVNAQPPPPGQVVDAMRVLDALSGATSSP
jgi:hypothetical protein